MTANPKGYIPEVHIFSGLPASGKSTAALKWVDKDPNRRTRINYDSLRREMFGDNWNWNRKDENLVQATAVKQFDNAMALGMSVVIDNTNLSRKVREQWSQRALAHNIEAQEREFNPSIWECMARDQARGKDRVGRAVIERMALWHGFIDWADKTEYYDQNFVVCDLDGTLADITERRKYVAQDPKDWKNFFADVSQDKLNAPVAELLDILAATHRILLVSGRPINPCGIQTEEWLRKYEIPYDHLFMRQGGDHRSDVIVKQEILDLLPKSRIAYVLDDRNSVVEMWRKNGLFCLQVADGNF